MLGPPGSGKGTHARVLSEHFSVPHLSTGAMLRGAIRAGSRLGDDVAAAVRAGELVDDEVIADLVDEVLASSSASSGWVLDGAPRSVAQARLLAPILESHGAASVIAIALDVPEHELRQRLLDRGEREGRADDRPEVVAHRLRLWAATGPPLLEWYDTRGMLHVVDGVGPVPDVSSRVIAAVARASAGWRGRDGSAER